MSIGAYTTKYHFSAILKKTKLLAGGKTSDSFQRREGNQFSLSPGGACSKLEENFKKEGFVMDHIVLRMGGNRGQIVLQTQSEDYSLKDDDDYDDWNDSVKAASLPHNPLGRAPWQERQNTDPDRYFDIYKFLTTYSGAYKHRPTLKVEDHIK